MLKKYFSFTVLALFVLLSFSCDEVAPVLNPGGDGPIDDVRLSRGELDVGQLLFTSESIQDTTVGYWKFESDPGLLRDSSGLGLDLNSDGKEAVYVEPAEQAFVDLCHVLLNSNSFLYVY